MGENDNSGIYVATLFLLVAIILATVYITSEISKIPEKIMLSEADLNKLISIEYTGGECERRGLLPQLFWKDLNGALYGELICV